MRERPCLVLIPGTLCDARLFEHQVRRLRTRARIVVLDYRRLRAGADWLAAQTRHLPPRFSVAGFSLGGLWALELLRTMPERIERLAMIASNAEAGTQGARRRSSALWRQWRSEGAADVARRLEPKYFHCASQRFKHDRLVRDMAQATPARAAPSDAQWVELRRCGHFVPLEAAAALSRWLEAWLARPPRPDADRR